MSAAMKPRELGDSGLKTTSMGLGLAALGRPGYINLGHDADLGGRRDVASMEAQTHQVLDAAWSEGIRYFDAARSYGRAEDFLGSWLRSRKPEGAVVGSKWGYTYTADWRVDAEAHEMKEHSLEVLDRQIAESRERLGDALNLYQIHSATLESGVLENESVLNRLAGLKAGGLRIGLSVSGPQQGDVIRKAIAIQIDGQRLFDTVQATWNLLEPSAGPALAEAHAAGMGVIVKEGLANGRLTDRNSEPGFAEKREQLQSVARLLNVSVDQLALAAVLRQPWAGVVLSGAATEEHLASNSNAARVDWTLGPGDRLNGLQEEPIAYWAARKALDWN